MDILDDLNEIKIGTSYILNDKELFAPPATIQELANVVVKYVTMPGWKQSISNCRSFDDLPKEAQNYVRQVELLINKPSMIFSGYMYFFINHFFNTLFYLNS